MIQMTVTKVTEVKNQLGELVGRSVLFKIPGLPPKEVSSLGGLSLFLLPSEDIYRVGQVISLEIHAEQSPS